MFNIYIFNLFKEPLTIKSKTGSFNGLYQVLFLWYNWVTNIATTPINSLFCFAEISKKI